jgi:hypothetical protein
VPENYNGNRKKSKRNHIWNRSVASSINASRKSLRGYWFPIVNAPSVGVEYSAAFLTRGESREKQNPHAKYYELVHLMPYISFTINNRRF